ncbi:MAG: transcriptional regulator [Candidatus Hodarchaeales archaeon]|jgi:DNA-binding MarR family transcriptional regulator
MNNDEKKPPMTDLHRLTAKEHKPFSSIPRFAIMLVVYTQEKAKIKDLTHLLNLTDGNIDHHLGILEREGLIKKKMTVFPKRVYSTIEITEKGKKLFKNYSKTLKHLL